MKRNAVAGALSVTLLGSVVVLWFSGATSRGRDSDKTARAAEPADPAALVEQAEQAEEEGEYKTALKHYTEAKKLRPKWATIHFKIAACQAALDMKEDAAKTLREVLRMKSASAELVAQARAALQKLLLPKLSDEQRKEWKRALALIQAGEELRQRQNDDLEIRVEHKLSAGPCRKAIKLLEKLTEDVPDYAPAHLSLGVAHESLLNFKQATDAFGKFLGWGTRNKLPELEQQAQVRQRWLVCKRRHQVDVGLAKRIPGVWAVSFDLGEERTTTTTTPSTTTTSLTTMKGETSTTKTTTDATITTTVTAPAFPTGVEIELLPGGRVNRREGAGWKLAKDTYWRVVDKRLIVGGLVGEPAEWCNLGPLVPSGNRFEGLTMDLHRTRYVRKGDRVRGSPNKPLKASAAHKTVTVTDAKTEKVIYRIALDVEVQDFRFTTDNLVVVGADGRASVFDGSTGKDPDVNRAVINAVAEQKKFIEGIEKRNKDAERFNTILADITEIFEKQLPFPEDVTGAKLPGTFQEKLANMNTRTNALKRLRAYHLKREIGSLLDFKKLLEHLAQDKTRATGRQSVTPVSPVEKNALHGFVVNQVKQPGLLAMIAEQEKNATKAISDAPRIGDKRKPVHKDRLQAATQLGKHLADLKSTIASCPTQTTITKRMGELAQAKATIKADPKKDQKSSQIQLTKIAEAEKALSVWLNQRRKLDRNTVTLLEASPPISPTAVIDQTKSYRKMKMDYEGIQSKVDRK